MTANATAFTTILKYIRMPRIFPNIPPRIMPMQIMVMTSNLFLYGSKDSIAKQTAAEMTEWIIARSSE